MAEETIAAIATPLGEGGISIVKISGAEAFSVIQKIFRPKNKQSFRQLKNRSIHYGHIINPQNNSLIDEVLVLLMKAPGTYTREDIVEIHCHGGIICSQKVLEVVMNQSVRLAEPGEFTKRAFLNGRIDLSQAEAVAEIVKAKTELSLKVSLDQLKGVFSQVINEIRNSLVEIVAFLEVEIDFSEEEGIDFQPVEIAGKIKDVLLKTKKLIRSFRTGDILKNGLKVAIIGRPNVGKSSLLNRLLKRDRAIVSQFPGTTRDTIEETFTLKGIPLVLVDTAGLRFPKDEIERLGVERTEQSIQEADLILAVFDTSTPWQEEDEKVKQTIKDKNHLIILNKIDLPWVIDETKLAGLEGVVKTSALTGQGIDLLEKAIVKKTSLQEAFLGEVIVTNLRHQKLLEEVAIVLSSALNLAQRNGGPELLAFELNEAQELLGQITGVKVQEEVLDYIFSHFCIGK